MENSTNQEVNLSVPQELIDAAEAIVSRGRTETPNLMLIRERTDRSVGNEKRVNRKNRLTLCF